MGERLLVGEGEVKGDAGRGVSGRQLKKRDPVKREAKQDLRSLTLLC